MGSGSPSHSVASLVVAVCALIIALCALAGIIVLAIRKSETLTLQHVSLGSSPDGDLIVTNLKHDTTLRLSGDKITMERANGNPIHFLADANGIRIDDAPLPDRPFITTSNASTSTSSNDGKTLLAPTSVSTSQIHAPVLQTGNGIRLQGLPSTSSLQIIDTDTTLAEYSVDGANTSALDEVTGSLQFNNGITMTPVAASGTSAAYIRISAPVQVEGDVVVDGDVVMSTSNMRLASSSTGTLQVQSGGTEVLTLESTACQFHVPTTLHGDVVAASNVSVSGNVAVTGTLSSNGALSVANTIDAQGAITGSSSITANSATLGSVNVLGDSSLQGTLTTHGAASMNGALTVQGLLQAVSSATVYGLTVTDDVSIGGDMSVSGSGTVSGTVSMGTLDATNAAITTMTNATTFTDVVTFAKNVQANSNIAFAPNGSDAWLDTQYPISYSVNNGSSTINDAYAVWSVAPGEIPTVEPPRIEGARISIHVTAYSGGSHATLVIYDLVDSTTDTRAIYLQPGGSIMLQAIQMSGLHWAIVSIYKEYVPS